MIHICSQPASLYFYWQIRAMLYSFKINDVDMSKVHVLLGVGDEDIPSQFDLLELEYSDVSFKYYNDDRIDKRYHPSIKPYLVYKHYIDNPYLENKTIFYHDCDIVLTKPIDFSKTMSDYIFYMSDTVSYIGYDYIYSKGENVLDKMTSIVNIDKSVVKKNQNNSGGAQYIIKNVNNLYWKSVYEDSNKLYFEMIDFLRTIPSKDKEYGLQIWCAEMWATLWNIWKIGRETRIHDSLNFSWATSCIADWNKYSIYHNAGVVNNNQKMFFKGDYTNNLPYNVKLNLDKDLSSYNYYNLIQDSNTIKK